MSESGFEPERYSQYEEDQLLRLIKMDLDSLVDDQKKTLRKLEEGLDSFVAFGSTVVEAVNLLGTISTNLSTFLTDWQNANQAPPNPAVKVNVVWGSPQSIPKGQ